MNLGTHLREKNERKYLGDTELFCTLVKLGQTKAYNVAVFSNFLEIKCKSKFRYPFKRNTYFCEISSYFGPYLRLVKPSSKKCTFLDFLEIEIWNCILETIWEISLYVYFLGVVSHFGPRWNFTKQRPKTLHFFQFLKIQILKYI